MDSDTTGRKPASEIFSWGVRDSPARLVYCLIGMRERRHAREPCSRRMWGVSWIRSCHGRYCQRIYVFLFKKAAQQWYVTARQPHPIDFLEVDYNGINNAELRGGKP